MKKAFTAEQISDWFTSGTAFANIKLSEEVPETKLDGTSSTQTSLVEVFDEDSLGTVTPDGGRAQIPKTAERTPLPPLGSCTYPTLPITKNRHKLISLIENNSVVIIRGATGSGKTTQLPQYILDHYNEKNASCKIAVTQPRKIGASSIARWVATQRKCTLGSLVGYQFSPPAIIVRNVFTHVRFGSWTNCDTKPPIVPVLSPASSSLPWPVIIGIPAGIVFIFGTVLLWFCQSRKHCPPPSTQTTQALPSPHRPPYRERERSCAAPSSSSSSPEKDCMASVNYEEYLAQQQLLLSQGGPTIPPKIYPKIYTDIHTHTHSHVDGKVHQHQHIHFQC